MHRTECVSCETEPVRFRMLVDREAGQAVGAVCERCLTAQFGDTIGDPAWRKPAGCALCDRDDFYALPSVSLTRETRGVDVATSRYEYAVDDGTLGLCDEHLGWLTDEVAARRPVAADGGV